MYEMFYDDNDASIEDAATDVMATLSAADLGDIAYELRDVLLPLLAANDHYQVGLAVTAGVWAYARRVAARMLCVEPMASDDTIVAAKEAIK